MVIVGYNATNALFRPTIFSGDCTCVRYNSIDVVFATCFNDSYCKHVKVTDKILPNIYLPWTTDCPHIIYFPYLLRTFEISLLYLYIFETMLLMCMLGDMWDTYVHEDFVWIKVTEPKNIIAYGFIIVMGCIAAIIKLVLTHFKDSILSQKILSILRVQS